jgi:molybdopterin synthase catalytic subunit
MIRVQREAFDAGAEIRALHAADGSVGALASFVGLVRGDDGLEAMTLEHYPGMSERVFAQIEAEARARFPVIDVTVIHRFGRLERGEEIVFVGASAAHRHVALEAASFIMDQVKIRAPFWKKEHRASCERWVEAKSADDAAAARWTQPRAAE